MRHAWYNISVEYVNSCEGNMCKQNVNKLLRTFQALTKSEQKAIVQSVIEMMNESKSRLESTCDQMVKKHAFKDSMPDCPYCGAQAKLGCIIKRGFKDNGAQRYFCKTCRKRFVATTGTVFEKTRKGADVWEKFIHMTISGKTIKECAEDCQLSVQTAFTWRHKVLNAFRIHQNSCTLSGKIEADEMLIPISYKGNHIKGAFTDSRKAGIGIDNNLPRESYKRGSDNKSNSSKDKACVFCMTKNGNEGFYAAVPGVGFMQTNMLEYTVGQHIEKESSLVLVDQYKITLNYLAANNYNHMALASNTSENPREHKPEVRDGYHLQHVNALHMHLRKFLADYYGVSSKYLENYVSLYIWLKNVAANKQKRYAKKVSVSRTSNPDCYISRKAIESRPAVPKCA